MYKVRRNKKRSRLIIVETAPCLNGVNGDLYVFTQFTKKSAEIKQNINGVVEKKIGLSDRCTHPIPESTIKKESWAHRPKLIIFTFSLALLLALLFLRVSLLARFNLGN